MKSNKCANIFQVITYHFAVISKEVTNRYITIAGYIRILFLKKGYKMLEAVSL